MTPRRRLVWLVVAGAAVVLAVAVVAVRRPRGGGRAPDDIASILAERRARASGSSARTAAAPGPAPSGPVPSAPRADPRQQDPAQALRDSSWETRLAAAKALAKRGDVPVRQRAELILAALRREVEAPTTAPPAEGSYLSATSMTRLHLAQALGSLGAEAVPVLRQGAATSGGEARAWALLALGFAGARDVAPSLRELLTSSPRGEVRMSAAHLLGKLGDRDAIPALRAALADTLTAAVARSDVVGRPRRRFHPVREQAASALQALGVTVERRGDAFVVRQ